jgi:hypothetical protein
MRPRTKLIAAVVLGATVAAVLAGVTLAAFSATTSNPTSSFTAAPDWVAPTVDATILGETAGGATYDSTVLADSPIGYWRLGESSGTTANDSSGNGRSGTYLGGYTLGAAGAISSSNTAVTFNNSDARAEITSSAFQLTSSLSVEAWARPAVNNGNNAIFDKTIGGNTNTSYLMYIGGGKPKCRLVKGGAQFDVASGTAVTANAWVHIVCTYDGANVRLYVNNALVATTALTGSIDTGSGVNIIGRLGGASYPFNGQLDEVAVYSTALSATRIAAHYDAASGDLTDEVRQCKPYYMYANVTDTGNPASGVSTVTSNLSSVTAGQTAAALTGGSYSVGSTSYNYRVGPVIADAAPGSPTYAITSTDAASNSGTQSGFGATVLAAATPPTSIFLTGLEQGVASSTAAGVFDTVVGSGVSADSSVKRNGSYSLKIAAANAATNTNVTYPATGDLRHPVVRFALRLNSLPSSTVRLFSFVNSGKDGDLVYDSASGTLGARFEGQTIVDGASAVSAGIWYLIEIKGDFNSATHTLDWRIDGVAQTQAAFAESGKDITTLSFGTAATNETYTANYDDIFASQTATDYPIGNGKVLALRPNGMGTSSGSGSFLNDDGTAIDSNTWTRLDELPATSSSDYVKQTANATSSYIEVTFENPAESCFNGVGARLAYNSPSATANDGEMRVLDGATSTVVYNGTMGVTSLTYKEAVVTPASTWTQSAVNGLVARIGYSSDTSPNPYFDDLLLEYDTPLG